MLEFGDGGVLRYGDQTGRWLKEAMTVGPLTRPDAAVGRGGAPPGPGDLTKFYKEEGVAAVFDRGPTSDLSAGGSNLTWQQQRMDGGTVLLESVAAEPVDPDGVPEVTLAVEHYNRMVRLLEHNVPVKVELHVDAKFTAEIEPNSFNIVGEIPGTDKADEIVLIGAHFDSWHGATGATDNASGVAAMMEALRIINATGLKPRRTIRIGLWAGEEQGLTGSRTYAREHLGTAASPKPEFGRTSAYFNLDNGTGKIRGIWMQGNAAVTPIFEPGGSSRSKDLGRGDPRSALRRRRPTTPLRRASACRRSSSCRSGTSTTRARTTRTWISTIACRPDDMKQIATVAAVFVWQAATRETLLPRRGAR